MMNAERKLNEAINMADDMIRHPISRAQLALAQKRTAASLRTAIALVCIIAALSVAGIWWIYGNSVSAVPQSAEFVWKDDQSCVYRVWYVLSSGRVTTIDAEASDVVCPVMPSLWLREAGPSSPSGG
jgi:hypothetical protein